MINKNVANIAKFDFLNTIRSKGFLILNAVLCILIIVALNLTSIIDIFKSSGIIKPSDYILEVYDTTGEVFNKLSTTYDSQKILEVKRVNEKLEYTFDNIKEDIIAININSGKDYMYDEIEVITKDTVSQDIYNFIENAITQVRNELIELKYNIAPEDAAKYKEQAQVTEIILSNAKNQNTLTSIITTVIGYIIFMLVMTITTTVASNIANEKTSKSAEYIFSTIPAKDYLNGKVLAANLKTLVTIILVVFYALLGFVINSAFFAGITVGNLDTSVDISKIGTEGLSIVNLIIYIVMVILLIFITNTLISYIQAWLASRIKSISELDSAIMLPTVLLVVAYFVSNLVFDAGNTLIYIISCVPILSMFILPTAYLLNKASSILVIISFAILVITLISVYRFVTSTFKNNILDLGNKKKLKKEQQEENIIKLERAKIANAKFGKFITSVAFTLILSIVLGNIFGIIPILFKNEALKYVANFLVFVIYIGLPAYVLSKMLGNEKQNKVDINENYKNKKFTMYLVGMAGVIVAQIINAMFINIFKIPQGAALEQALQAPTSFLGIILFILYIAVIPAIFEELLFRKVMLKGAKRFGTIFAIVFTSVMFGLFHQNLQQILGTALIGFVLAFVAVKTGDIKTSIWLHFTNNLFAALAQIIYQIKNETLMLIFTAIELVIIVIIITGLVIAIKLLIKDRKSLKVKSEKIINFKLSTFISNYYMIILLSMIVTTVILYLKV